MNIRDVLYMRNTGKLRPRASIQDKLFGKKLYDENSGIITTTSGNPVSIITSKAQDAISTILSYSAKQSGSGDPSPQNIRPIEGWTEANLFGCGKNLCDAVAYEIPANSIWNTVWEGSLTGELTVSFDNTTVTAEVPTAGRFIRLIVDGEIEELYFRNQNKTITGTLTKIEVLGSYAYVRASGTLKMQVEVGNQATAYEPYTQGANITANLGGTYYGFSVDLERGVLRVANKLIDFTGFSGDIYRAGQSGGRYMFQCNWTDDELEQGDVLCNILPQADVRASTNDVGLRIGNSSYFEKNCITIRPEYPCTMSIEDFRAWIAEQSAIYICIPLAEPIEIPLTPQIVTLLKGNNTLWTDADEITITYLAKK